MKTLDPGRSPEPMELNLAREVQSLRRTVRDLAALSALPCIWVDCDLQRSLQNLADVLRAALRAFTVCVRVELPDGSQFDTSASEGLSNVPPPGCHAAEMLDAAGPNLTEVFEIPRFNGSGPLNALPCPVFFESRQVGYFLACYKADVVPSSSDRLLLQVASNQAALLFKRHKDQEERFGRKMAEARLRQTEHHYQQLVQSLPAAVYTCDTEGRITLYNEAAAALWGRRPKLGEDKWCGSWKIFNPDGSPLPLEECPMAVAVRERRSIRGQEIIVERPDGSRAWVLPHPDPILDEAGRVVGTVNMLVVVDELKRAEQAARRSEERIHSLLNLMPAAVYSCDAQGRITFYNRRAAELWGCEPALENNQQTFCAAFRCWFADQVLAPADTPMAIAVREGKAFRDLEPVFERPDGSKSSVLVNIDPLFDEEGKPAGAINVFQDITPLKRAEEELRRKTSQLAAFLETAAIGLHRVGPDGIIQWANPAEMRMLGYSPEEYIGHHITEFHADAPTIDTILKRLTCGDKIFECEARLRCKDGSLKHVLIDSSVLWEDGQFVHTQCFTRDITQRKRAEEALARSQKQLAQQVEDLERLHERSVRLTGEQDLAMVFDEVLRAALEVHGTDRGLLSMFDAGTGALEVKSSKGFTPHFLEMVNQVPPGAGACGSCFEHKKRIIVEDTENDPVFAPYRDAAKLGGFRSVHSTPLLTRSGKIIGVLSVHFAQPRRPADREMRLMDLYARQVADIIEDLGLREGLKRELAERKLAEELLRKRGERLQLLSETLAQLLSARNPDTIVRDLFPKVAAHLAVDTYFNFMVTPEGDALALDSCLGVPDDTARKIRRLEFGQSISGRVAQSRESIHATDIQNSEDEKVQLVRGFGIQCYACNPLLVGGRLLGTLSFASRTRTAFDEEELQFLGILSQYTAVALDRLKAAAQLRESEERFRAVLDNSTALIYVKDGDGKYLLVNECYQRLLHVPEAQLLGKTDFDLYPAEVAQKVRENDLMVFRTGKPLEIEEVAPFNDGPHTYTSIKFPLRRSDGVIYALAGISTDITERKRAQETTARLAAIVEHSEDAIFSTDLDGIITSWNGGAQRLYGYNTAEAIGQSVHLLVPEELRVEEASILDRIRGGQIIQNLETLRRHKNGSLFDVSLTVSPIKDPKGNLIGLSKVARDITDKVRAKEKLEQTVSERTAQLRDTVAELEAFSYSVAHDMRAPLRAMNSYSRLLQADFADALPPEGKDFVRRIAAGATRLDSLITDVLNYSKIARSEMLLEKADVQNLTQEIIDSYPNLRGPNITIEVRSPFPPVMGNVAALTQCISNLLSNAIKFVAPGTAPHVVIRSEVKSDYVRLWFEDNGIGISEEGQRRIFRLFQRLHPAAKFEGTGIGLTIVRKAVERMNGRVGVESQLGVGSRFWIELKKAADA